MRNKNQHVVPKGGQWAIVGAGHGRATSKHRTQKAAIRRARTIAKNQRSELLIHGRNGRIREKNSYGRDSHPPAG